MNISEFIKKYGETNSVDTIEVNDILWRVSSNLSDLKMEQQFKSTEEINEKIDALREYLSDFRSVMKTQEDHKRYMFGKYGEKETV